MFPQQKIPKITESFITSQKRLRTDVGISQTFIFHLWHHSEPCIAMFTYTMRNKWVLHSQTHNTAATGKELLSNSYCYFFWLFAKSCLCWQRPSSRVLYKQLCCSLSKQQTGARVLDKGQPSSWRELLLGQGLSFELKWFATAHRHCAAGHIIIRICCKM